MLCVFSLNTLDSKWVPWEIGYGYDKTNLSTLTLKGISDNQLPAYLRTVPLIRGTQTLNNYISGVKGEFETKMFSAGLLMEHSKQGHPLDNYLDWKL